MRTANFRTTILIDGGWFAPVLSKALGLKQRYPSPQAVYEHAISILKEDEILYRIFYYDSKPYDKGKKHPLSGEMKDFAQTISYKARETFLRSLGKMPQVALRLGEVRFRGWELSPKWKRKVIKDHIAEIQTNDIMPAFEQKGVDMRIGVDITTLALKKLVDRIILLSHDTDMLPAMKLARVEGIQICLIKIGNLEPRLPMIHDSDFLREIKFPETSG